MAPSASLPPNGAPRDSENVSVPPLPFERHDELRHSPGIGIHGSALYAASALYLPL
jgi:hypothetical protein